MLKKYLINIKWVICNCTPLLHPRLTSGCSRITLSEGIFRCMRRCLFNVSLLLLFIVSTGVKGRELSSSELTQRSPLNFFLLGILGSETEPGCLWNCTQQHSRNYPNPCWYSWNCSAFYPSNYSEMPSYPSKKLFCLNQLEVVSFLFC